MPPHSRIVGEGLTFDDVLLIPGPSSVHPRDVDLRTKLTATIDLNLPILSAAMDTVTEANLAKALAQEGGLGVIHRNLSPVLQAEEVDKVKRSESGMILDPITLTPDRPVSDAEELMSRYRISGVPVTTKDGKLVGILTNRDLRFMARTDQPIADVMTKENLVTVPVGTSLEDAKRILHENRVEKLPVVDERGYLKGLITVKDIMKRKQYPQACKDEHGRLRVGAAVGTSADLEERVDRLAAGEGGCAVHRHRARTRRGGVRRDPSREAGESLDSGDRGEHRHRFRRGGAHSRGGGCDQGGCGPRGDVHDARRGGRRRAAVHRDHGRGRGGACARCPDHRGRRHQVFRRDREESRRRCLGGDDRKPVRGHGGESRRDRAVPRTLVQAGARNGVALGDEGRKRRSLLPGFRRRKRRSSFPRGSRGAFRSADRWRIRCTSSPAGCARGWDTAAPRISRSCAKRRASSASPPRDFARAILTTWRSRRRRRTTYARERAASGAAASSSSNRR